MLSDKQWDLVGDAVLSGRYNLLVGAGISLDSGSGFVGKNCPSGRGLASELASVIPGIHPSSNLSRIRRAMNSEQVADLITKRFTGCSPGNTVKALTKFRWKRIFTLNIDDALERAYELEQPPIQTFKSYNHDSLYESERDLRLLPIIHLHGWAREPDRGYIFDLTEYAHSMARHNVWAHVLSDLIRSEPFLIIGTLLDEPDLPFFMTFRGDVIPRGDAPPSLLIEPYPDAATNADCQTYKLELFDNTALEFLEELERRFPVRPSVIAAIQENLGDISSLPVEPLQLAEFNADFERVSLEHGMDSDGGANFAYGHQATWGDLREHRDLDRPENRLLQERVGTAGKLTIVVVAGEPGAGKTTTLRRFAWNITQTGTPCLWVRSVGRIRTSSAFAVLSKMDTKVYVCVDNLADNIFEIADLHERLRNKNIVFVAAERDYRLGHVIKVVGPGVIETIGLHPIGTVTAERLIDAYRDLGLAAARTADSSKHPLGRELIAVACCRILNNFEPLTSILDKSLGHRPDDVDCYVFAALATHCHRRGVEFDVISNSYRDYKVDLQIERPGPLPLKLDTVFDTDFVTPANESVSTALLGRFANREPERLLRIFIELAIAIAPRVNIRTIIKGEPCARIATRLFDYDEVVKPLLGRTASGEFYERTKSAWDWNSRYWHQRAQYRLDLAGASNDIAAKRQHADFAVQHARFAETIEPNHQFTHTTIGRMLFGRIQMLQLPSSIDVSDAIEALDKAIQIEHKNGRPTVHPFMTLFTGLSDAIGLGAVLSPDQRVAVTSHIDRSIALFVRDNQIQEEAMRLRRLV